MKKRPGKPLLDQKTASTLRKGIIIGCGAMFIFSFLALPLWVLKVLMASVALGGGIYLLEKYTGLPGLFLRKLQARKEERVTRITEASKPEQTRIPGPEKPDQDQLIQGEYRELPPGDKK